MPRNTAIEVSTPARLHLGFLDLNGSLGRRFGSLGLAIGAFGTHVRVSLADRDEVCETQSARLIPWLVRLREWLGVRHCFAVDVRDAPPAHAGLGSGTQLALALGAGVCRLVNASATIADIARALGRGARSGVGIAAFEHGGFIMDAGSTMDREAPCVVSRIAFPEAWRVILVLDSASQGLHGTQETQAFRALAPQSEAAAGEICRLALMRVMPGLIEHDLRQFGGAITAIQAMVGDHFASVQGGRFRSPAVADALHWLQRKGVDCVGQSSWGPTGFAVVESAERAGALRDEWKHEHRHSPIEWRVCAAQNSGASVSQIVAHRAAGANRY